MSLKSHNPGDVEQTLHCVSCDYDLRGLSEDAYCPECGLPVDVSAGKHLLRHADAKWAKQLRLGINLLIASVIVATLVVFGFSVIVGFNAPQELEKIPENLWLLAVMMIPSTMSLIAMYFLTRPEPDPAFAEYDTPLRRWVWIFAIASFVLGPIEFRYPDWPTLHPVLLVAGILVATLSVVELVLFCLFGMHHARRLQATPKLQLHWHTKIIMYGLAGCTAATLLISLAIFFADYFGMLQQESDIGLGVQLFGKMINTPWAALQLPAAGGAAVFSIWSLWIVLVYRGRISREAKLAAENENQST